MTLEEMGGARMHATVSGCGDNLAVDDADAIEQAKQLFSYLPDSWRGVPSTVDPDEPVRPLQRDALPAEEAAGYDMHRVIDGLVDDDSFFALKPLFAPEVITGLARLEGRRSASSPTTRCTRAASCSATPPTRRRASSGCATPTTCPCCSSPTCPGS